MTTKPFLLPLLVLFFFFNDSSNGSDHHFLVPSLSDLPTYLSPPSALSWSNKIQMGSRGALRLKTHFGKFSISMPWLGEVLWSVPAGSCQIGQSITTQILNTYNKPLHLPSTLQLTKQFYISSHWTCATNLWVDRANLWILNSLFHFNFCNLWPRILTKTVPSAWSVLVSLLAWETST